MSLTRKQLISPSPMTNWIDMRRSLDDLIEAWDSNYTNIDGHRAYNYLTIMGRLSEHLSSARTNLRYHLGRLLLMIQEKQLFNDLGLGRFENWEEFMKEGVVQIAGLGRRTCYSAMSLARHQSIRNLTEEQRGRIPLGNATLISRMPPERVTPEVIDEAAEKAFRYFRKKFNVSEGYRIDVWFTNPHTAKKIEELIEMFRFASAPAINSLMEFLESAELLKRTGESMDDKIDLILATMEQAFQQEEDEIKAQLEPKLPEGHDDDRES